MVKQQKFRKDIDKEDILLYFMSNNKNKNDENHIIRLYTLEFSLYGDANIKKVKRDIKEIESNDYFDSWVEPEFVEMIRNYE